MLDRNYKIHSGVVSPVRIIALFSFIFILFALTVSAQNNNKKNSLPLWQSYREISIGMTMDQVHEKLGKPKSEDAESIFYMFSETETAQFLLDADKKVKTISVIFAAEHTGAPLFADVFGKTVQAEPRGDGSIFKMIRYEEAGYWVSYNRTAGEQAMVIVMIQKL